jgi:hypothetical protein
MRHRRAHVKQLTRSVLRHFVEAPRGAAEPVADALRRN